MGQIISRGSGRAPRKILKFRLSESLFLTDFYVRTLRAIVILFECRRYVGWAMAHPAEPALKISAQNNFFTVTFFISCLHTTIYVQLLCIIAWVCVSLEPCV